MSSGDLARHFYTGVWQWILTLIPLAIFYVIGGFSMVQLEENPMLRLLTIGLLLVGGFIISGWGARGAVARVR